MLNSLSANYLIADANHPLITTGSFKTEARLYNLDAVAQARLFSSYKKICSKSLDASTLLTSFSGGEKVVLMALLALFCPAPRICFIDLWHALDPDKRIILKELISKSPKELILRDSQC